MATPTNRATLITYCKQRLGHPVIELNLNDDQISDHKIIKIKLKI